MSVKKKSTWSSSSRSQIYKAKKKSASATFQNSFINKRAKKAAKKIKEHTKRAYAITKNGFMRIYRSRRIRKGLLLGRQRIKTSMERVDFEFLQKTCALALIAYMILFIVTNRFRDKVKSVSACFLVSAMSLWFEIVPMSFVRRAYAFAKNDAAKMLANDVPKALYDVRDKARTYFKKHYPIHVLKMDKFVRVYATEVKVALVFSFFFVLFVAFKLMFNAKKDEEKKPASPLSHHAKTKKQRIKGPIQVNVALVTGASGNVGAKILSQLRKKYPDYIIYGTSRSGSIDFKAGNALQEMFNMMSPNSKAVATTSLVNVPLCCTKVSEIPPLLRMDVTDDLSVNAVRDAIIARHGKGSLKILVNNAGICAASLASKMPIDMAKKTFETNYFGILRVVSSFYADAIPKHQKATIINVGSIAGRVGIPFQSSYSSSKAAVGVYTDALRMESKRDGVRVCLVEPGDLKPGMEVEHAKEIETDEIAKRAVNIMRTDEKNGSNPMQVADAVCKAARPWRTPNARILIGPDAWLVEFCTSYLWKSVQEMFLAAHYRVPPRSNSFWRFIV
jgi:NAD(P)-dependent dehydrogenase (short-subunit alcohol dehydrogenase family)